MAYVTAQSLAQETDPGFPVDVIVRANGRLRAVVEFLDWDEAVSRALLAMEGGFTVEMEESDAWRGADEPFPDEFDRQA